MNAYEVLGVEQGASAAEINIAYKEKILLYAERTDEEAAAKTEEINAAYDSLMYSGQTTFNSSSEPSIKYGDVRAKINEERYEDAQTILDGVPIDMRDGEWYFLKGRLRMRQITIKRLSALSLIIANTLRRLMILKTNEREHTGKNRTLTLPQTAVVLAAFAICAQRLLVATVCVHACDEKESKSSIWWYNIRVFRYLDIAR